MTTRKIGDIQLNGKQYMLADGSSSENATYQTAFAPKQVTGDYSLSDFEQYSITAQTDLRGGIGQLVLDDTTEYAWGHRIDARGERVTLGPKLASTQASAYDTSGTVGELEINGASLNFGIANEPENQSLTWQSLDNDVSRIAVPFTTGAGSSFTPSDINGLVLWFDAAQDAYTDDAATVAAGNNDTVAVWQDQSGQGNHATNTTAAQRPTYKTNEVNSLPAIKGDGSADWLQLANGAPITGSGARTIFIVAKAGAADGDHFLDLGNYGTGTTTGADFSIANNNGLRVYCNNGFRKWSTGVSTSAYEIVCIKGDGANTNTLTAYIDGAALSVDSTTAASLNTGDDGALFRRTDTTPYTAGYLAEVIVYNSDLSTSDRLRVESHLGTKYGISVSSTTYSIRKAWAYVRTRDGFVGTTYRLAVYSDSGGDPDTLVTNAEGDIAAADVGYYGKWVSVDFDAAVSLTASTDYHLVCEVSGSHTAGDSLEIMTVSDSDIGEVGKTYDGSWAAMTTATALLTAQYQTVYPDSPPVKFVEFGTSVYAAAGKYLYKIDSPTSVSVVGHAYGNDITDLLVVQKKADAAAKLLVAMSSATAMETWDGVTTYATVTGEEADRLCLHDNLFWRATEDSTSGVHVQGTSDYADWSGAGTAGTDITVGDRRYPVKALFSWRGTLYAGKADGLYAITYGDTYPAAGVAGQANKVLDFSTEIHDNTFTAYAQFQGDLFFSLANGLARYSSSSVLSSVSPDASLLNQEQQRGQFTCLVGTLGQLYAGYESAVEDWSQWLSYTGTGWHSLATSDRTGDMIRAIFVDSGLYSDLPRIWTASQLIVTSWVQPTWSLRRWTFAEDDANSNIKFFDRAAGSYFDECSGRLYTSWIDGGLVNIIKDWISLDVIASNLDTDSYYINVYYRFDEGDAWTLLGKVDTEPAETLDFATSTTSRRVQLRFDFYTTESYNSPELWGFAIRFVERPEPKLYFTIQLILADKLLMHNGSTEQRSVAQQWSDIADARAADEAITFVDSAGVSYTVHVDQITRQRVSQTQVNGVLYENAYALVMGLREA